MKKKLLKSMRVLLVAAGLCTGANAWADDYLTLYSQDYSNVDTYNQYWTTGVYADSYVGSVKNAAAGATISQNSRTVGESTVYYIDLKSNNNSNRGAYFSIPVTGNNYDYSIDFDMAISQPFYDATNINWFIVTSVDGTDLAVFNVKSSNSQSGKSSLDIYNSTSLSSTIATCSHGVRGNLIWYHITLTVTEENGVQMTVTKEDGATSVLTNATLSSEKNNLSKLTFWFNPGYTNSGSNHQGAMANFVKKMNITPYMTRAESAKSAGTSISSSKMDATIASALTTALASSYIDYTASDITTSNIDAYITAIESLETAVANAQASASEYAFWKAVYDAADAKALTVSSACQTAFETATADMLSAYTAGTLTLPDNTNAVKGTLAAALIDAGETDLTAVIYNADFELGTLDGWTVTGDAATAESDADKYGIIEDSYVIDGSYHYYTGYNGRNVSQLIAGLPAGYYTLTAKANSWGASCALVANGGASDVYASISSLTNLSYDFIVYGNETSVNIGIAGTNGASSPYTNGGTWGYRCDDFTLTYLGADPLASEKASLNDEIETAQALYDSWTAKVGTAPFKYDATYYNALGTQISSATSVLNGGSTTASDYTDAETALETAESNMASSVMNQPDGTKYYRMYLAGTNLNVNLLNANTFSVKITETPAAVKIVPVNSGYNIRDVYGNNLCHDKNNSWKWGTNTGVEMRGERFTAAIQADGTVKFNSAYGSIDLSAAGQTDGSNVGRGNSYVTWEVSDAVDVTDVTLSVNAAAGWGTFIAPYDNLIPSTVKAFTVSYAANNVVYFTENETGVLSANTPYILSTEEADNVSATFKGIANNTEDTYTVNGLVGLLTASTVPADSYVLQYNDSKVGFYKTTSNIEGTANRCYLNLESVPTSASSRASVSFGIYEGEFMGIDSLNSGELKAESFYNLNGQRIAVPAKGLYIVNGKKVVLK